MKHTQTTDIRGLTRQEMPKKKPRTKAQAQPWQASFSKRLPHRVGQPLSSSSGGDGSCSLEQ